MKIRLSDVPREGKDWLLSRGQEPDLDQALADILTHQEGYQLQLALRPLDQNGTYHISGQVKTQWSEACSLCSEDFPFLVHSHFNEVLVPRLETPRNASTSKVHHVDSTDDLDHAAFEYEHGVFELGEFVHEILVLARPLAPRPACHSNGQCSHCHRSLEEVQTWLQSLAPSMEDAKPSPFAVLKSLKN